MRIRRRKSKKFRFLLGGLLLFLVLGVAAVVHYVSKPDQFLEVDFERAETLFEQGEYKEAVALYQSIHKRQPDFHLAPQALFQSGEILNLFLNKYHEALIAYLRLIKDYPHSEFALRAKRQEADIYKHRLRDFERAIVAYHNLLDQGGDEPDRLQYELADSYFRLENFEQARIEFEILARDFPHSTLLPEVNYRIGAAWSLEGELKKAEEIFRHTMHTWPEETYGLEAAFALAAVLEEREELLASLQILDDLTELYPNREILDKKTDQVRERIRKKKGDDALPEQTKEL